MVPNVPHQISSEIERFAGTQYHHAYQLIDASRYDNGLYADAYHTFEAAPGAMGSIAATGVGLVGLALADLEGWDPHATDKLTQTLNLLTHDHSDASGPVARDPASGFFYHFFDGKTGAAWRGSEISTIDTAILVAGAMLAARITGARHPHIAQLANKLLHSIDWRLAIAGDGRSINMTIEQGQGARPNDPFSEYAIVAYLAHLSNPDSELGASAWNRVYRPDQLDTLRRIEYQGLRLFGYVNADGTPNYLSSFVCQFPLYLIPDYAESESYLEAVRDHCLADRFSWQLAGDTPGYLWGHGAGNNNGLPSPGAGYRVDNIGRSSGVASAYIVAGFLPVFPAAIYDLYALYRLHLPFDQVPRHVDDQQLGTAYRFGLGRFSWNDRWYPQQITLIDWSTMLYGFAAYRHGMQLFGNNPSVDASNGNDRD